MTFKPKNVASILLPWASILARRSRSLYSYYSGQIDQKIYTQNVKDNTAWKILRYEHVVDPKLFPYVLPRHTYVRPETFEKHLFYFLKECNVIPLKELVQLLTTNQQVPAKTVALTFDCGWKDFYLNAFPLLNKYNMPATLFLPTSFMGSGNLFWPDKILVCLGLLEEKKMPFPTFAAVDEELSLKKQHNVFKGKITAYKVAMLIDFLRNSVPDARNYVLVHLISIIEELTGIPYLEVFMNWDEVKAVSQVPDFDFASLTHSHFYADEIRREAFLEDVGMSLLELNENKIKYFNAVAYPEGIISEPTLPLLENLQIKYAFGIGNFPPSNLLSEETKLFGRIPIYQSASFSVDLLADHIWNRGDR